MKLKTLLLTLLLLSGLSGVTYAEFAERWYENRMMGKTYSSMEGLGPTPVFEFYNNNPVEPEFGQQQDFKSFVDAEEGFSAVAMKDGKIIFEHYNEELEAAPDFHVNANSFTKTLASTVIGHLLCKGSIKSLEDTAGLYSKSLLGTAYEDITIKNLLRMASGVNENRDEEKFYNHSLKNGGGYAIYANDSIEIIKLIDKKFSEQGNLSRYHSLDTVAISILVKELTGKSVAEIFHDEIFSKMGASGSLYWMKDMNDISVDINGAYMNTRDWAKFGQFISENINAKTCLGDFFLSGMKNSLTPVYGGDGYQKYGYHFWVQNILGKPMIVPKGARGMTMVINHYDNTIVVLISVSKNARYGDRDIRKEIAPSIVRKLNGW